MCSGNWEFIQLRQLSKAKIKLLAMSIPIDIHTNMQIAPPLSFVVPLDHGYSLIYWARDLHENLSSCFFSHVAHGIAQDVMPTLPQNHKPCQHLPNLSSRPIQALVCWSNWNGNWEHITSAPPLIPIRSEIISKGVMAAHRFCSDGLSPPLWLPILLYSLFSRHTVLSPSQVSKAPHTAVCLLLHLDFPP